MSTTAENSGPTENSINPGQLPFTNTVSSNASTTASTEMTGPPTFTDDELERLEVAKSFARSIQQLVSSKILLILIF